MCFSLGWLENLLIGAVILACIIAVLKILVPWAFSKFGFTPGPIITIISYIVWAIIVIYVIIIVFGLLECLFSGGLGSFSLFPHRG